MVRIYKFNKKKNFFLDIDIDDVKQRAAKLYIRKTFSNIFITITDLNDKVIICRSSGSSDTSNNKRRKTIAQAVERIVYYIVKFLNLYNIKYLHLILKMRIKAHVFTLLTRLNYYGFEILSIISRRKIAHNGVRGKSLRRL